MNYKILVDGKLHEYAKTLSSATKSAKETGGGSIYKFVPKWRGYSDKEWKFVKTIKKKNPSLPSGKWVKVHSIKLLKSGAVQVRKLASKITNPSKKKTYRVGYIDRGKGEYDELEAKSKAEAKKFVINRFPYKITIKYVEEIK
jgi:hypothetical protein